MMGLIPCFRVFAGFSEQFMCNGIVKDVQDMGEYINTSCHIIVNIYRPELVECSC